LKSQSGSFKPVETGFGGVERLSKKKKKTALIDQINWIFRKTKK
jgi:hypothetical protein